MNILREFVTDMPITSFFLVLMIVTTVVAICTGILGLMIPAMLLGLVAMIAQVADERIKRNKR